MEEDEKLGAKFQRRFETWKMGRSLILFSHFGARRNRSGENRHAKIHFKSSPVSSFPLNIQLTP